MFTFYAKIFAKYYDSFMFSFESKIKDDRKSMINSLHGRVLDVGSGTGINFEFFNDGVEVIAVEPSKSMLDKSITKVKNKNIKLLNLGINDDELLTEIAENSLDGIVSTLVLCTIPDPELAIENFKKWLKPNGKLIVLEHIHSDKKYRALIESIFNPVWRVIGEGCNLNRKTDELIKEKGFTVKKESYFTLGLRIHKAEYILKKTK